MSNQLNFSQQMDEVLKTLGDTRPRLLLHACCGPCSSAVLERLCRYFDITVLYYNPNTWPAEEYHRRGEELERFAAAAHPLGVTVRARSGSLRRNVSGLSGNLASKIAVTSAEIPPLPHKTLRSQVFAGTPIQETDSGECRDKCTFYASVAQSVEQGTENPRVIGSIPIGGTTSKCQPLVWQSCEARPL